jgi:hypothetical protein
MQDSKGINSLKQAREILDRHAPKGEHLAYINDEEATHLKNRGGSGIMTVSGIRSYGFLKKITKPFAKVLDKIVPNEIKPALPFIAAAVPFLASYGLLGSTLGNLSTAQSALLGAGANVIAQSSQEGAAKYGINPLSVGLAALGGALAAPTAGAEFGALKTLPAPGVSLEGIDSLTQLGYAPSAIPTPPVNLSGIDSLDQLGYNIRGTELSPSGQLGSLDKLQNVAASLGEKGATCF